MQVMIIVCDWCREVFTLLYPESEWAKCPKCGRHVSYDDQTKRMVDRLKEAANHPKGE